MSTKNALRLPPPESRGLPECLLQYLDYIKIIKNKATNEPKHMDGC